MFTCLGLNMKSYMASTMVLSRVPRVDKQAAENGWSAEKQEVGRRCGLEIVIDRVPLPGGELCNTRQELPFCVLQR